MGFFFPLNIFISFVGDVDYLFYIVILRTNVLDQSKRPSRHLDNLGQIIASSNCQGCLLEKCSGGGTFSLVYLIAAKINIMY